MFLKGPRKLLLIHGPPRSGKTTLVEKLFKSISSLGKDYHLTGFITKEIRNFGERTGFDLIFLRDESVKLPLARVNEKGFQGKGRYQVGKYQVYPENLETFLEILERDFSNAKLPPLLFIDEIGKMEIISRRFIHFLEELRKREIPLVATVGRGEHPVLKEWSKTRDAVHVEVSPENRNYLFERLWVEFIRGGKLIVVEGIDGAGKTTLINMLRKDKTSSDWIFSQEPTDREIGRKLRRLLKEGTVNQRELLKLFVLDRQDHVENLILPSLNSGKIVLLDRYYLSTVAYQGVEFDDLWELLKMNETIAPLPDLVIYLEVPFETALERVSQRGDQRTLFEKEELLKRIAENYEKILPLFRYYRLKTYKSPEELHREIMYILENWV